MIRFITLTTLLTAGCSDAAKQTQTPPLRSPVNLVAQGKDEIVELEWSPVSKASEYYLYWSTSENVDKFSDRIIAQDTSYRHTGLINDTEYFYRVAAVGSGKQVGALSPIVSVKPLAVPPAVNDFTVTQNEQSLDINWAQVEGLSYNLYWATDSETPPSDFNKHPTPVNSPFQHAGLDINNTYYYMLTAENTSGESDFSPIVSNTPLPAGSAPDRPELTAQSDPGTGHIMLTWPPTPKADTYRLYVGDHADVETTEPNQIPGQGETVTSPFTFTDAIAGQTYYFVLVANNGYGDGPAAVARETTWLHPQSLADGFSDSRYPAQAAATAVDGNGNAVVVWQQTVEGTDRIFLSHYVDGQWRLPTGPTDYISGAGNARVPEVAMSKNGTAIVVWREVQDGFYQIFKSEYKNGTNGYQWDHDTGNVSQISLPQTTATAHDVSMNANGDIVIAWEQDYTGGGGVNTHIYTSTFHNNTWTHPATIDDYINIHLPSETRAKDPDTGMDGDGNYIVVWTQENDGSRHAYRSEFCVTECPWGNVKQAQLVGSGLPSSQSYVTVNAYGEAVIVWNQSTELYRLHFRNGTWVNETTNFNRQIGETFTPVYRLDLAILPDGHSMIAWEQNDGIYASEYIDGTWRDPVNAPMSIGDLRAGGPSISAANNGILLAWHQFNGSQYQVFMRQWRNGVWHTPTDTADSISLNATKALFPATALADDGSAIVAWSQDSSTDANATGIILVSEYLY